MNRFVRYAGQGVVYGVIALLIGFFANAPPYERVSPDKAVIKLSLVHAGKRGDCRERTPEELAKLPPNMRKTVISPRERSPIVIGLELSGEIIYAASTSWMPFRMGRTQIAVTPSRCVYTTGWFVEHSKALDARLHKHLRG